MRLIHTADWHLCDRLGRVDRTQDLRDRVEQVAAICETHNADVLLIAGDLFSEGIQVTLDVMNEALDHLFKTFTGFFERGGTILAITGNHDREVRAESIRLGMRLAMPEGGRRFRPGRMYLLNQPFAGTLETNSGESAQFALVPYPTTVRYGLPTDQFRSKADEHRALNGRVAEWLNDTKVKLDPKLPTVLVGHLHVAGAGPSHALYRISETDDVIFDTGFLPVAWAYVALGHIHKPQALGGLPHVRYSGSLDRLDLGERDDEKGVVLLDLCPDGLVGVPQTLPLPATPMCKLEIADPAAELPRLADRVENRETALVHVTVTYVPGGPGRDEIMHAIRTAFPRYTDIVWTKSEVATGEGHSGSIKPGADYRATVREYLARELKDDRDRDELLKLADRFLTAEAAQ